MKIQIGIPNVKIVESTDHKGNPVSYLSILGVPVLYSTPRLMQISPEAWEDIFKARLGGLLGRALLEDSDFSEWFLDSPTGHGVITEGEAD